VDVAAEGLNFHSTKTHFAARVDEDYFTTMSIPIISGRAFRKQDDLRSPLVAIVNRAFADRYWPGQNPIGKRFHRDSIDGPWVEIVGVTPTTKYLWVGEGPVEYVYLPMRQSPAARMSLVAHTKGDPAAMETVLRGVIQDLDHEVPIFDAMTMHHLYNARVVVAGGTSTELVALMGIIGMTLSMIGLYGLVSYSVARRTREFGIRLAIGASPASILQLVLSQGTRLAAIGLIVGLLLSFAAGKAVIATFPAASGVSNIYVPVALALGIVIALAALIPARRASRVDPNVALRQE
jgi:putative ABC transport system permease protein